MRGYDLAALAAMLAPSMPSPRTTLGVSTRGTTIEASGPMTFYVTKTGAVVAVEYAPFLPCPDELKGARIMRRAERRQRVGLKSWRNGFRAPKRA